jgi:hypothetical protein
MDFPLPLVIGGDPLYQARILDKNRKLVAILPGVRWHYTRRINEATDVSIYIPREIIDEVVAPDHPLYGFLGAAQPVVVEGAPKRERDNKPAYAAIASYVQVYQGDKLRASGKIVGRDLGQVVTVHAMTEEILLEANLTPAQYGKVWDGWDLADVARDLLDGWQTIRVKAPEQWQQYMVDSYRVDLTTDPGLVMLAKDAEGKYYQSGYITLAFSADEIPNFKRWDRIRWSADSDGSGGPGQEPIVRTTMQWSPNGSSWSAEWDGGLPEEVGYYIGGTYPQVYVRINLYTNDTESEDDEGNPVGVTPTVFACELIARTQGPGVAVGNIPATAGVRVKSLDADHTSALQVLVAACEQADWEFTVWNGALSVAETLGTDRTRDFVFRGGSNIEIVALGDDDDELVNVLTAYSPGQGINRMEITLRDEASINEYGEYPAAVEFDVGTLAELEQKAEEFLSEHNSPKTQFEIAVAFEHGKEPAYGLGDNVRVADPDTGIVTKARIMSETREYAESGLSVRLELGKASLNLQQVLEGKPQKPADPMAPTGIWARGIVRGIRVGFSKPKGDWDSTEVHVSTASGFTPSGGTLRDVGKQTQFDILELEPRTRYYAKVVHIDSAGRKSEPSKEASAVPITMQEEQQKDYTKDYTGGVEDYIKGISPVLLVSELPELPDPRYPVGTIVFLITEEKLYRNDGENWVLLISMDLSELEGKLQSNQIELEAIKEDLIAAGAIASRHIQIEAVTAPKIAHEAVTADKIAVDAVTAPKIAADAVTAEKIATGAITETKISDDAISTPKLKAGAIEANKLAANAVTAEKIAANAVTADKIAAGAVETEKLAANAITAGKIAANAVTADKIAAGAVETEKLAANAITAGKIAAGAIETNHISAGAVKADQIDANAVTTTKILAGAVTADKIAANAVTTNKINAGAVTAEKIAARAIQTWHLEAGAVTADKLYVDETTTNKIIAGIAQIGGLAADHIKAGEISYDKLKVRFAKVTSALGGYDSDFQIPPTTLIEANSPDDWNLLIWANGVSTFNRTARFIINHQSFDTLMGSIVLQFSYNGSVWSDQIDLAYCSVSDNFEYTVGDYTFKVAPFLATNERVEMFVQYGEGSPRTPHLRFKRHAIA